MQDTKRITIKRRGYNTAYDGGDVRITVSQKYKNVSPVFVFPVGMTYAGLIITRKQAADILKQMRFSAK